MRSTSKITNSNSLYYLNKNFNAFNKVSNQIATERQVVNLEDDPLSANIGMKLSSIIAKTTQYNRNIKTGVGALGLTDGYLTSCKALLDKIKTITVGAANDPTDSAGRAANAIEMNELLKSIVSAGNANDGTRYIFGGQNTTTPPFTIVNGRYVHYTGNDQDVNVKIDNGTTIAINCTGTQAYGNMITKIPSRDMNPDVNLGTDRSTSLSDLNGGSGVPKGKIVVYYSAYPEGLEVDLSGCDTLEDVKDVIEKTTLEASRNLDPVNHAWLDGGTMDWHDLQDRYVKVTVNPEHNGISLQEFDRGEPLPEPDVFEQRKGIAYSASYPGGAGSPGIADKLNVETTVFDKEDAIYQSKPGAVYAPLRVDNHANNRVADALGIKGTATKFNPDASGDPTDPVLEGFIHGTDLNPRLSDSTLLADLEGYNDSVYTFTNGAEPGSIVIKEVPSTDSGNVFNEWKLTGLSKGDNTSPTGGLYARAVNRGTATNPEIYVEIYSCPIADAKASDLVATGVYTGGGDGGTVLLKEANDSGVGGTVGILLPAGIKEATANLEVDFSDTLQASIHVPAFVEETDADGQPLDILDIFSGWNIRGLDKPPADGYDRNHPASTDLDGDVSVNYRYDDATKSFVVELCRPAFADQPAKIIATGSIYIGDNNGPPLGNAVTGRIQFEGASGFEGVGGSVYVELPANCAFAAAGAMTGASADDKTANTYMLQDDAAAGTIVFGGATELQANLAVSNIGFYLAGDTVFKAGQTFLNDVILPNGGLIRAGTVLDRDVKVPKGAFVQTDELIEGTVLAEGQRLTTLGTLPPGTVIPRGSYYESSPGGFPAEAMSVSVARVDPNTGLTVTVPRNGTAGGFDLRATFATIEDLNRAIEQAGVYVTSRVSDDGKGLEFLSSLAGAYLTVSEDTDCYEQMGDVHQQLTGLDLNGLVKGVSADKNGNVYTEVIYYPPNPPPRENEKVKLTNDDGTFVEVDPGYYVRVYSDPDELKKSYENRDNGKLVAEGFVPAGKANPDWDPEQPYDPAAVPPNVPYLPADPPYTLGSMQNLILEERNDSGVWGTVNFDYYGTRDQAVLDANGEYDFNPWENGDITVFPGGLRPEGSRHTTIQEWDMHNVIPGVTCDYSGTYHGTITKDPNHPNEPAVCLYKDSSRSVMTARSVEPGTVVNGVAIPYEENGKVILYEVDRYGNLALDANKNPIVAGSMVVSRNELQDGQTDNFTLTTGAARNYGQKREENVFSTINDVIDALHQNDLEALHNLIGATQRDVQRILDAQGDVGARTQRLNLLSERHADDLVRYKSSFTSRVGMDDQALTTAIMNYQASYNAYQAAMQVSGQLMQLSMLQFI